MLFTQIACCIKMVCPICPAGSIMQRFHGSETERLSMDEGRFYFKNSLNNVFSAVLFSILLPA